MLGKTLDSFLGFIFLEGTSLRLPIILSKKVCFSSKFFALEAGYHHFPVSRSHIA
jgi:hypothetical protein